ncbi:MAG: hypothetical protein EBY74_06470 [Actinobacteria bacterium]|nr:hypothetical protein [Actinomycetota bacterium]
MKRSATLNEHKKPKKVWRRCDACSARARFYVKFTFGTLEFCNHHFRKHEVVLNQIATSITTEGNNGNADRN